MVSDRKPRADGQKTGLAGEFFVAAELLKRGFQTSLTFGTAKAIDLLAVHPQSGEVFKVQVKAVRRRGVFPINHAKVDRSVVYVFVTLNEIGVPPGFAVVPGEVLADQPERFSKWFLDVKFPGFAWSVLVAGGFVDAWDAFGSVGEVTA